MNVFVKFVKDCDKNMFVIFKYFLFLSLLLMWKSLVNNFVIEVVKIC